MRWKKRGGRKEKEMMIPSRMILKDRLMIFQMKVKRLGGLYLETSGTYCLPCILSTMQGGGTTINAFLTGGLTILTDL